MLRLERAIGAIDGVNVDFATPVPYVSGSLHVFRNGNLGDAGSDNGWTETDPLAGAFRMKVAPLPPNPALPAVAMDPGDILDVVFNDGAASVGGAPGGVPALLAAVSLAPKATGAKSIHPTIVASDDPEAIKPPKIASSEALEPTVAAALDFKPKIVSSREVV